MLVVMLVVVLLGQECAGEQADLADAVLLVELDRERSREEQRRDKLHKSGFLHFALIKI